MTENIYLIEVAALPLLLIMIVSTVSRKLYKGRANILLFWILVLAFLSSLADTVANAFPLPLNDFEVEFTSVVNYFYFITRNGLNCAYVFYIIAVTRTWYRIRPLWRKVLLIAPYICILGLLVMNVYDGSLFTVTNEAGYQRGDNMVFMYLIAMSYMAFGTVYLIVNRKLLTLSEWLSLSALYIFNVVGVVIQMIFPHLLVECYFTSITLLFIVLYVQKPEKQVDMNTGLSGYFAFRQVMSKIEMTRQQVQIIIISINNADELSRYLGDEKYLELVHNIDRALAAFARKEKLPYELYFEAPGRFYIITPDMNYNPVLGVQDTRDFIRKQYVGGASDIDIGVDIKIVSAKFPEEIDNAAEIIHFAHSYTRFTSDRILYHSDQIIGQRLYQIETRFDEILKRAISDQKLIITYRPVWSAAEGRAVFAEAVTHIEDPDFGMIDERTLWDAAVARGVTVILEEYVIELVFAYLRQNDIQKEGLSHIVVKLSDSLGMQKRFTDYVWKLRGRYDVHPEQIAFSIQGTERGFVGDSFRENLMQLRRQGYRISLDNYGSGYTNIRGMSGLTIDSVRIDRRMINREMNDTEKAILRGTISMIRSIPLDVVVPDVDDEETRDMVLEMGCELMQGALFDAGAPEAEPVVDPRAEGGKN